MNGSSVATTATFVISKIEVVITTASSVVMNGSVVATTATFVINKIEAVITTASSIVMNGSDVATTATFVVIAAVGYSFPVNTRSAGPVM